MLAWQLGSSTDTNPSRASPSTITSAFILLYLYPLKSINGTEPFRLPSTRPLFTLASIWASSATSPSRGSLLSNRPSFTLFVDTFPTKSSLPGWMSLTLPFTATCPIEVEISPSKRTFRVSPFAEPSMLILPHFAIILAAPPLNRDNEEVIFTTSLALASTAMWGTSYDRCFAFERSRNLPRRLTINFLFSV